MFCLDRLAILKIENKGLPRSAVRNERLEELEAMLSDKEKHIKELEEEKRTLLKIKRDHEKKLMETSDADSGFEEKNHQLKEDMRVLKANLKKYKEIYEEQRKIISLQQKEADKLVKDIERLKTKIGSSEDDGKGEEFYKKQLEEKAAIIDVREEFVVFV